LLPLQSMPRFRLAMGDLVNLYLRHDLRDNLAKMPMMGQINDLSDLRLIKEL